MSQEALSIHRRQRAYQIEHGSFSEEFNIVGGGTFRGEFDRSYIYKNRDSANIEQQTLNARIIVPEIPVELIGKESIAKIIRESGDTTEYIVSTFGEDDEGVPVIWLR